MKINDTQPPDDDSTVNTDNLDSDDVDSSSNSGDDQPSAFSQMLAKKREADREGLQSQRGKGMQSGSNLEPGATSFQAFDQARNAPAAVAAMDSKHVVALPPDLQQLVREISVAANQAGNQQVHIEMNSTVMKGLQIRIERHEGTLAIQFQSQSDQVTSLLSKNVEALSQGLMNLGERAVEIRVAGPKDFAKGSDFRNRSGQGGRGGQRGYGGGRG
jgi:hypothetical protein